MFFSNYPGFVALCWWPLNYFGTSSLLFMYPDDGNSLAIDFDFLAVDIDIFLYSYLLGLWLFRYLYFVNLLPIQRLFYRFTIAVTLKLYCDIFYQAFGCYFIYFSFQCYDCPALLHFNYLNGYSWCDWLLLPDWLLIRRCSLFKCCWSFCLTVYLMKVH